MTSNGRVGRLTALALATGTLVAVSSSAAFAATTTTTTDQIQALGDGNVIHLRVALPAALPEVGQIIDQYISTTKGTVTTVSSLGATSVGQIGSGQVKYLSDLLGGTASSDLGGKQSDQVALVNQKIDDLGLTVKALAAESKVAKPTVDGVLAESHSTVTDLELLNLLGLPVAGNAALPVADALEDVLGTVDQTSQQATSTVIGALGTVQQQLEDAAPAASGATKTAITTTQTALGQLQNAISTKVNALDANTKLIDLGVMTSAQKISRSGAQVTSEVTNELAGLNLLGGLITVDALQSKAMATAGGAPGTASVIHEPGVLTLKVADLLTLEIGKTIKLGGTIGDNLPADLATQVDGALATVLDLLRQQLGLDFIPAASSEFVSKDGKSASTTVSAATLILNPPVIADLLPAGEKLLKLELVKAEAAVGAQVLKTTKTTGSNPATTPISREAALPRTGANLPLTGGVAAAVIMGLAVAARRRRAAMITE